MSIVLGFDFNSEFKKIKDSALRAIRQTFPVEGQKHKLVIKDVWIEDNLDFYDHREQKQTKLNRGTWAEPLFAALDLIDITTGEVIDSVKKFKLFNLPKVTSRYSYIVEGNEYQTINQLRLKSGVYSRVKANNQLESQFNLARGANFKVILNQETESFYINLGTSNIRLLPILLDLGMSAQEVEAAWGKDLFESNQKASKGVMTTEIMKLHSKLLRKDAEDRQAAIVGVADYFAGKTELNPKVTKRNLGKEYSKVSTGLMLDASKKILNISRGTEGPDDRDSLVSKEVHSIEDFIYERLDKNRDKIERSIRRNLDKRSKIREIVSLDTFNDPVKTLFTGTSLAATTEQTNPVDMMSNKWEVTIMGEGGITNDRQVTNRARAVHPTHFGFVDPFQTPESGNVGSVLQMAITTTKDKNSLKTAVYDMGKKGNPLTQIDPEEAFESYMAFPDEYNVVNNKLKPIGAKVKCMHKGEIQEVPTGKIKYVMASTKGMLGMPTNLVPFANSNSGARILMAGKMLRQALSLKDREEQLVQTSMGAGTTFNKSVGKSLNAVAGVDGVIEEVSGDSILIKAKDGKSYEHQIYNDFPLNQKTFLDEKASVTVGQKVKKGDVITDSNYTKNGDLALGINLRTAYLPMKGYSFEDSIVVSETAAKKLTSGHMYRFYQRIDSGTVMNLKKFDAYYPGVVLPDSGRKLDAQGVIKKGAIVEKGDIIVAALVMAEINPEDEMLSRISKSLVKPFRNKSQAWEYSFRGVVTDVVKTKKRIDVYVKSEEPAVIGDKLSGVHGNKGTIGLIMPDNEMPKTKDGVVLEMALNPHSIPSRKNPGQVLETIASKVAEKTGKPYIIDNFEDKNYYKKVKADAKKAGVKETEVLIDPKTGMKLGDIMVGKQYVLKLNHPTRKKFSARSYGGGYTAEMQPGRGGSKGAMSMDALTINGLLSHGARNILRETHSIKGEKNDEYWRAMQLGMPLPPPQASFIYDKFINYLKATGIDVAKNGTKLQLLPLTNDQIEEMSNGEVENISIVRGKNLKAERGGLFDPKIFGGIAGSKWGKVTLTEPVPNPIFENAIKAVTELKKSEYEGIVNGNVFVNKAGEIIEGTEGITGGAAIKTILKKINLEKELVALKKRSKTAKKTELNKINKKLRYLAALKRMDRKPTDYVLDKIPVIPPKFRPIYQLPDGNPIVSDLNELYKGVKSISDQLKGSEIPEYDKCNLRRDMYKSVKALFGLGQSLTKPDLRGTIQELKGDNPKFGLIQQRMIKRRQDLTGRSVISPDPTLGVDEVGIPEKMAWSIYKPFIVKRMVGSGYSPLEAQQKIEERHPVAIESLHREVEARPVLLNRAPTLHKFGIMAFKPKVIQGKAIKVSMLPCKGYNADMDGDEACAIVLVKSQKDNIYKVEQEYSKCYLKERELSAKFKSTVPGVRDDENLYMFDLEDFPKGEFIKTVDTSTGPINFYDVPKGIEVLSYNEATKQLEWSEVNQWTEHPDREVEIATLRSGRQIITDDDPRAIYGINAGTLEFTTNIPEAAAAYKMLVPTMAKLETIDSTEAVKIDFKNYTVGGKANLVKENIELNDSFGYLMGLAISEGWLDNSVHISGITNEVIAKFNESLRGLFEDGVPKWQTIESKTSYGKSLKHTWSSINLSKNMAPLIGHGARNKHLPPFFLNSPKGFREGLAAGLMDGDGCICVSHAKKNPQLMVTYFTTSLRLAREVVLLFASLGVKSRIYSGKTPAGLPAWQINMSNYEAKNTWQAKGMVHPVKLAKLASVDVKANTGPLVRHDIVPISKKLATMLRKKLGAPRNATKEHKSIYTMLHKSFSTGFLTRHTSKRIINKLSRSFVLGHPDGQKWLDIVNNTDVTWDQVESFEKTGIKETGYDLSVPGNQNFMNSEGVILHNTMSVHVPITEEGKQEALKMLPSNHLLNPGSGRLMLVPSMESVLGIWLLTEKGKTKKLKFDNIVDARESIRAGKITVTDVVTIDGIRTTTGRYLFNAILPKPLRDYNIQIDKKQMVKILEKVVDKYKSDYGRIADGIKDLGNKHSYYSGFSMRLEDIEPLTADRDRILKVAIRAIEKFKKTSPLKKNLDKKIIEEYTKATEKMRSVMVDRLGAKGNSFYKMMTSGSKGGTNDAMQIVMAPMLLMGSDNKVIPIPVTKSYAEGLTTSDMWTQSYAARKGVIDRSRESSSPGELSKMLASTMMNDVISADDCGTKQGIDMNISDENILDRYSAEGVSGVVKYNEVITTRVISMAKKKKITTMKVRSPLKCEAVQGVCAKCSGLDENGQDYELGTNVGVIAAQSISEPAVQLVMRTFHTGGTAAASGGGIVGAFDRVKQVLTMPQNLPNKATLSSQDGEVKNISKSPIGGYDIYVNNAKHHVKAGFDLKVKRGDKIRSGDPLSAGVIKPQELMEYKGVDAVQTHMSDTLYDLYKDDGPINRRIIEQIIKVITSLTKIVQPGNSNYIGGDIAPLNKINAINKGLSKDDQIIHSPILKGINMLPSAMTAAEDTDWMGRLGYRYIKKTIEEGTSQGWSSDLHGYHPVPGLLYAKEFGQGEKGKY